MNLHAGQREMSVSLSVKKATDYARKDERIQKREGKLGFLLSFARRTRDCVSEKTEMRLNLIRHGFAAPPSP